MAPLRTLVKGSAQMITYKVKGTGPTKYDGDGSIQSRFSLEVEQFDGTGATWIINSEGSLDGLTNWTAFLTHTNANPGDGQIESMGAAAFPCKFRRINVIAINLGTNSCLVVKTEAIP